jgi:hypothetical protein
MREEIRLGNAALARNDLETAKQHFQALLDRGGTHIQEQIATNRLRDIQAKQAALRSPPSAPPPKRRTVPRGTTTPARTEPGEDHG